jgi:hypothetical protein
MSENKICTDVHTYLNSYYLHDIHVYESRKQWLAHESQTVLFYLIFPLMKHSANMKHYRY